MKKILSMMAISLILATPSFSQNAQRQGEILRAYDSINDALIKSTRKFIDSIHDGKLVTLIKQIEASPDRSPKTISVLNTLHQIKSRSDDLKTFIKGLMDSLQANAKDDGDFDITRKLLAKGPAGKLLKKKLTDYISDVHSLMKSYSLTGDPTFPIDASTRIPWVEKRGKKQSWERAYFDEVPMVAALTILNWLENNVKDTETMCADRLSKQK